MARIPKLERDARRRNKRDRYELVRGYPEADVSTCVTCGTPTVAHKPRGDRMAFSIVRLIYSDKLPRLELLVGDRGVGRTVDDEQQGRELSALIALRGGMLYRLDVRPTPHEWAAVAIFPTREDRDAATIAIAEDTSMNVRVAGENTR